MQYETRNASFKLVFSTNIENLIFRFRANWRPKLLRRFVTFRRRAECRISSAGFAYLEAGNAPESADYSNPDGVSNIFFDWHASQFADPIGLPQNTRIYCEKHIFHVIIRQSKTKLTRLSQSRLTTNPRSRKSLQNPCEIEHFNVFDVANASTFWILNRFCSVFLTSYFLWNRVSLERAEMNKIAKL